MKRLGLVLAIAIIVTLVMGVVPAARTLAQSAYTLTGTETRITTDYADQYDPHISGNIIVYTDARGNDLDVWYYDLSTDQEQPITSALGDQELADVSDGLIAYSDYDTCDTMIFSVADRTTTDLTPDPNFCTISPGIGQGLVAWQDGHDGNWEIYAKNIASGEERRITNSPLPVMDERPNVDNGTIVWMSSVNSICDIYSYDWATGVTRQITNTPSYDERNPDVSGKYVVYEGLRSGEKDIYLFDLTTGVEKALSLPGEQNTPNISGEYVAFEDTASGVYHVKLWHFTSSEIFDLTTAPNGPPATAGQFLNDIDGNRIVYTDDRNGQLDIYMYEFQLISNNVQPTVSVGSGATIDEGGAFTRTGSFTDPDADTWTATVDYGDGTGPQPLTPKADKTFDLIHVYADNGSYNVIVTVTDSNGGVGSGTLTVTVNNVAPTAQIVSVSNPSPLLPKVDTVTFQGSFYDPGVNDAPVAVWDFGDNTPKISGTSAQHVYSSPGVYTVTLTVTDKDGGVGKATTSLTVVNGQQATSSIVTHIQALPNSDFSLLPGWLYSKWELTRELNVAAWFIDHKMYGAAILELQLNVRPKMDGSLTPNNWLDDLNDWITDATEQQALCRMIDDEIAYLRTLQ